MGCHAGFQRIFLTQRSNQRLLCLLHWQVSSLLLASFGKPPVYYPCPSLHLACLPMVRLSVPYLDNWENCEQTEVSHEVKQCINWKLFLCIDGFSVSLSGSVTEALVANTNKNCFPMLHPVSRAQSHAKLEGSRLPPRASCCLSTALKSSCRGLLIFYSQTRKINVVVLTTT